MLYAKFMYPNSGHEHDKEHARNVGLIVGERYEVESISMGQSSTSVYLKDIKGYFNSVQFDFEEDGKSIDIFKSPTYNLYLQNT